MVLLRVAVLLAAPGFALAQANDSTMVRIQQFSCNVKDGSAGGSLRNI